MEEMKAMFNATNEINGENGTSTQSGTSLTSFQVLSLVILTLETIIGTFMNGLMVIPNLISLLTHRKLDTCDVIFTCLGLSRFTFMWLILDTFLASYIVATVSNEVAYIQYVWLFFNYLSLWLATWLTTFYCVRVVNIQSYIFTTLKTNFDRLLPFLILLSVVISASCSNSAVYTGIKETFNESIFGKQENSATLVGFGDSFATFSLLCVLGSIPPFFVFCLSTGVVVYSLLRHMKKMKKQERTGFREPSLDVHWRAIKMMVAFFIFFLLYMIAFNLYGSGNIENGTLCCTAIFLIGAYPSIHSALLVIGNHKLKYICVQILQKVNCCQKEVIGIISD